MRNRNTAGFLYVFFAAVLFSIGGLCIKMVPWNGMAINSALLYPGGRYAEPGCETSPAFHTDVKRKGSFLRFIPLR